MGVGGMYLVGVWSDMCAVGLGGRRGNGKWEEKGEKASPGRRSANKQSHQHCMTETQQFSKIKFY